MLLQSITYLLLLALGCALACRGAWLCLGRRRSAAAGLTLGLPGTAALGLAVMLGIGVSPILTSAPAPVIARSADATADSPAFNQRDVLLAISACESEDNPSAVSTDGMYRGKYQFDVATWRSIGGRGDPALASEPEQDHRALTLLRIRGSQPWPRCGRLNGEYIPALSVGAAAERDGAAVAPRPCTEFDYQVSNSGGLTRRCSSVRLANAEPSPGSGG